MPVRMRNGASSWFSSSTTIELPAEALLVEAVGHGQAGAVVGEDEVLATEPPGRLGHLADGAAAVGPVRVRVAVAAQRPEQQRGRTVAVELEVGVRRLGLQLREVGGHLPAQRLGDDLCRRLAHPLQALQPTRRGQDLQILGRDVGDRPGGVAEGTDLVGVRTAALESERDLVEGIERLHR